MSRVRVNFFVTFIFTSFVLIAAFYWQFIKHHPPCLFCLIDQIIFCIIAIISLIALWHNPTFKGRRVYSFLIAGLALLGMGLSGYQLWLQSWPSEHALSCGASLPLFLQQLPTAVDFYSASTVPQCNHVEGSLLGLSLAVWALLCFALLLLFTCYQLFFNQSQHRFNRC